jgi:hypothetical protein
MSHPLFRGRLAVPGIVGALLASGCATAFHGRSQKVEVVTSPPGAIAEALGQKIRTPGMLRLPREAPFVQIRIQKEGYSPQIVRLDRTGSGAVWWNLAGIPVGLAAGVAGSTLGSLGSNSTAGGLGGAGLAGLGFAADYSSGAAYELVPRKVVVRLEPVETAGTK